MKTLGAHIQLLRAGERTKAHRHTGSIVYTNGSSWTMQGGSNGYLQGGATITLQGTGFLGAYFVVKSSGLIDIQAEWQKRKQEVNEIVQKDVANYNKMFKDKNVPAVMSVPKEVDVNN